MNKITLIGNLTADPVQRDTSNGKKVTDFRIAVNRRFGGNNGEKVTDFFRIKAWGAQSEACYKYLAKGRKVAVVGELHADTYTDREGMTRMALDVVADEVEFLSPRQEQAEEPRPKAKEKYTEADFTDLQSDDIPF